MRRIILFIGALAVLNACSLQQHDGEKSTSAEAAKSTVSSTAKDAQLKADATLKEHKTEAGEKAETAIVKVEQAAESANTKAEQEREDAAKLAQQEEARLKKEAEAKAQAEREAAERAEQEAKALAEREAAEAKAAQEAKELAEREAAEKAAQKKEAERLAAEKKAAEAKAKAQQLAAANASAGFYLPKTENAELGGSVLTAVGAERKGNAAGSIPEWTGKMRSAPGRAFRSGDVYPDPYANDNVLFTIKADNADNYGGQLSEGLKTLFKKYPDTFYMNIYPSHRDGRYNDITEQRTKWNSSNTKLVNGVDGLSNYTGGVPFPKPKNANEVLWNGRIIHPHPTVNGVMDDIAVYLNGNKQQRRQTFVSEFPFAYQDNPVGKTDEEISVNAGYVHVTIERPERQKGQMTIVHEAVDQVKNERMAWVYIPGSRRVRRAPTVGYDTPDGPGGLVTVDDSLGFNGAMDRYDWKLLGKKEMYIPYHSYKFDSPNVKYDNLLMKGHANPEYMRYELHRVWVVEANLKRGARHVYLKRRFYIDEDSWHIVLVESFDGRGDLWRVGILNTVYDFAVQGFVARAQVYHDMQSGGYIAMRLVNETSPVRMTDKPQGENYYSPANLRKLGR